MSISISFHTQTKGLMVSYEYPSNSHSIELCNEKNDKITFYVTLENWWALRSLPKAPGYVYSPGNGEAAIYDQAEADAAALAYYEANAQDIDPNAPHYSPTVSKEAVK